MESIARKKFLYEPTKEFNEIDQEQQLDKTSNNFPKLNEEYFHCSCEHCYIMPSSIKNKCCRRVQIIQQKLINEKNASPAHLASTSYVWTPRCWRC